MHYLNNIVKKANKLENKYKPAATMSQRFETVNNEKDNNEGYAKKMFAKSLPIHYRNKSSDDRYNKDFTAGLNATLDKEGKVYENDILLKLLNKIDILEQKYSDKKKELKQAQSELV